MSRRSQRSRREAGEAAGAEAGRAKRDAGRAKRDAGRPARGAGPRGEAATGRAGSGWGLGVQVVFLAAVFGVVVLIAELAGAANLGVALGIGQIAFAIAVMYLLLRR